jgi:exosortase
MAEGSGTAQTPNAPAIVGAATRPVRPTPSEWLGLAALFAVLWPGLREMAAVWNRVDYSSHGYLIPFVALWAASAQRHVLPQLPRRRDMRGAAALVVALLAYLLGLVAGEVWLAGVAGVAALAGAILYARGLAWLGALVFPLGYLLFMVPIPDAWLAPVIVRLQLLVSSVGTAILQALGQPVLRTGNVLQLSGGEQLFVAEACSGITSLITLVPLGVFLAYFTVRGNARRAWLVLTVIPVALAGNLVRVLLTVGLANRIGAKAATESSLHEWIGLSTYVVACLVVLGLGQIMRRAESSGPVA